MIKKEEFLLGFNGHSNSYSHYMVLNTTIDAVIAVLNAIDESMCVGSGVERDGHVSFEICKEEPTLIHDITKRLNTIGYADTDWDETYTVCSKNGEDFDDYTARWEPGMFYFRGDFDKSDKTWDAFVEITDNETGAIFHTGAGGIGKKTMLYYKDMVEKHS